VTPLDSTDPRPPIRPGRLRTEPDRHHPTDPEQPGRERDQAAGRARPAVSSVGLVPRRPDSVRWDSPPQKPGRPASSRKARPTSGGPVCRPDQAHRDNRTSCGDGSAVLGRIGRPGQETPRLVPRQKPGRDPRPDPKALRAKFATSWPVGSMIWATHWCSTGVLRDVLGKRLRLHQSLRCRCYHSCSPRMFTKSIEMHR
jgi:hypothetical protein